MLRPNGYNNRKEANWSRVTKGAARTACHWPFLRRPWKKFFSWLQPQSHMGASADLRATSSMSTLLARSLLPSEPIDCPQPRRSSHTQQSPALPAQSLIPSYVHFFPARLLPFSPPLLIPQIPHLLSPTHEYTFTLSQSQRALL